MSDGDQLTVAWVRAIQGGTRCLGLVTGEEDRALRLAEDVGALLGRPVHTWSLASGPDELGRPEPLLERLHLLARASTEDLWVLFEAATAARSPLERRALRELAKRRAGPIVVLVEPVATDLAPVPEIVLDELAPMGLEELTRVLGRAFAALGRVPDDRELAACARAAEGLPARELERIVAGRRAQEDTAALVEALQRDKITALDRTRLLEPELAVPMGELGGLPTFKAWIARRALALRPEAAIAGIPWPRGVLLVGVQGAGKSLAARACADALQLPIVRLDPGRLFAGTLGESESNLRRVTEALERMAPVVVWIDEIEKGFAGHDGSRSDGGTAARVLGGFLTWLEGRRRPVFVAATANRIDGLPPELLRRGRLDEIFFVDLPPAEARAEILRIHLAVVPRRRLGAVPPCVDDETTLLAVARAADGVSGAELEAALVEARLCAFAENRALAADDLRRALAAAVPLSVSHAEALADLRRWANGRARPA